MTNALYVKEFLTAMYADGKIQHDVTRLGDAFSFVDLDREVELTVQADAYIVTGRTYAADHGCEEEIELLVTADADQALARFETAVDSLTSV